MGRTAAGEEVEEMTLIDFGDFKIRFDPKEVRINIDGEIVDIGARRNCDDVLVKEELTQTLGKNYIMSPEGNTIKGKLPEINEGPIRPIGWKIIDEEKAKKILGQKSP
jgi:hypothetical protein